MEPMLVPLELMTGVHEMDAQHDHLFQQMARVKQAFLAVSGDSAEGLQLLSRLADDLVRHYAWESAAAVQLGIPFGDHAREHARMAAFVAAKIGEIERGSCNIPALMVYMERKFESHVAHYDLQLAKSLQAALARQQVA